MAVPNLWRTKKQRYSLHGEVCDHCMPAIFPPREVCPHCHKPMQAVSTASALLGAARVQAAQPMPQPMVGDD